MSIQCYSFVTHFKLLPSLLFESRVKSERKKENIYQSIKNIKQQKKKAQTREKKTFHAFSAAFFRFFFLHFNPAFHS